MNIPLPNNQILNIKRTARKGSVGLKVTWDFNTLLVPRRYSDRKITRFIESERAWLEDSITRQRAKLALRTELIEDDGAAYLFGEVLTITWDDALKGSEFECAKNWLICPLKWQKQPGLVSAAIEICLFNEVEAYIFLRVNELARQMGVESRLGKVTVKNYKARWGSCYADGRVQFNWRLAMAPKAVIDSVIVHELAHLMHLNHSKAFWGLVFSHCADYKIHHQWLKENTQRLMRF